MPHLFDPLKQRSITFRNRIGVSPMCQYSSIEGRATDWHLVHLGSRAVGGAAMVMMEATAIEPRGRISPGDNGIWSDAHLPQLSRITQFIDEQGSIAAVQLAHAGRKATREIPWVGENAVASDAGGWNVIGPSPIAFAEGYQSPQELTGIEIKGLVASFAAAAKRAKDAGFKLIELHGAHGYLIHNFLSPLSNQRRDEFGGSFENRIRFLIEVTQAVRKVWPEELPLWVRLSCSDWAEGGWTLAESVQLSGLLKKEGVDLIDCSSGGNAILAKIPVGSGYQIPFAEAIRKKANVATGAVGMITDPMQADEIIRNGRADMIFLARELLRDPYWPLHAAKAVHQMKVAPVPLQYKRAF